MNKKGLFAAIFKLIRDQNMIFIEKLVLLHTRKRNRIALQKCSDSSKESRHQKCLLKDQIPELKYGG